MQQVQKMILNLPLQEVERAFQFLADPLEQSPPEELHHLSTLEWQALSLLLNQLYHEKSLHLLN